MKYTVTGPNGLRNFLDSQLITPLVERCGNMDVGRHETRAATLAAWFLPRVLRLTSSLRAISRSFAGVGHFFVRIL